MNETSYSYFWFGGSFFKKLRPHLQEKGNVSGQLTGISPISEISTSMIEGNGSLTCWLPELDAKLTECNADYFLLDLQLALQQLLVSGGKLIAATAENQSRLTRKEIAVVDPILMPQRVVDGAMEGLVNVLAKHFSAKRIILIHTHNSPYWLVGNNLRSDASPAADARHAKWLADLEKQFCRMTGCHFVDVTRFYFYQKEEGKPLTNVIFEKECYADVAERIFDIVRGGDGKAERPNFVYSLDRYVAYYFTIQRKPQRVFLNPDYFLDQLILSSSDNFVKKYRQELIDLDTLDWTDSRKALDALNRFRPDCVVTKVCNAFYAVINGNYTDPNVDYALMFRLEVAPEALIAYLKKNYAHKVRLLPNQILPNQITRYNAGCHFARMRGVDPAPYCTELTVEQPTVIDIFGSCISRTLFNVQENDFTVNNYWFHVPPFEFRNKPVKFEQDLFPENPSWTQRLVKQQLECGVYQKIRLSQGEWLVVDLYSLISPNNYYYEDCIFGDFDHKTCTKLKAKKISFINGQNPIGSQMQVIAALDPWLKVIQKKYGKKIILVEGRRLRHWIGDDNKIYQLARFSDCEDFLRRAADYFIEKTDCYSVDIGNYFLADELGMMRNTPTHRENLGYLAAHDIVRHIVDTMPKQKRFVQYSGTIQMKHLIRLAEKNSLAVLEQALPLSALDKAVVQLGQEQMLQWQDELAKVYDLSDWTMSLEKVISSCGVSIALADALRRAAKTKKSAPPKIQTDYAKYAEADGIISGPAGNCVLPNFPQVKFIRTINDKNEITIAWASPKAEKVRVYRRSQNSNWVCIGTSNTESFVDRMVAPRTEYEYSLCAEVVQQDVTLLGNFVAAQKVTSAVGVPVLVSAVNFAGRNTFCWMPVEGAEHYRVYHKDSLKSRWELCCTMDASEPTCFSEVSKFPTGGEWYTVRAVCSINGKDVAGGFQSGLQAAPL